MQTDQPCCRTNRRAAVPSRITPVVIAVMTVCAGVTRAQSQKVPTFKPAVAFSAGSASTRPWGICAGDFAGPEVGVTPDGYPDIVIVTRGPELGVAVSMVVVFLNQGVNLDGSWAEFGPPMQYLLDPTTDTKAYEVAAANLNPADDPLGLPDIVIGAARSNDIFVFLNNDSNYGALILSQRLPMSPNFEPRGLTVGYFGASSSVLDVAVASAHEDRVAFLRNLDGGTGQFEIGSETSLGTGIATYDVVGGQFTDGAGNDDAVTPDWTSDSLYGCQQGVFDHFSVLENQGNYVFADSQQVGNCSVPRNYRTLARGRFETGGGDDDIVAVEECRPVLDVILGTSYDMWSHDCATDQYQMHPTSGPDIHGAATGHLNGGTKTDVVAAIWSTNEVAFLLGRGDGTFQRPAADSGYLVSTFDPAFAQGVAPVQVIVTDLDQDGFGDIVTTNEGSGLVGSISVLINKMEVISIPPE